MSGSAEEMFWSIFSCTSFLLLIPYLLNFEAFLKLRRTDKTTVRPYIFPGPSWFAVLMVRIGEFIILATMFLLSGYLELLSISNRVCSCLLELY